MSRTFSAINDKHQRQSKVSYQAYFTNPNEPREHTSAYMPAELEAELLENSAPMKQKLRRLARTMRNR